ncbi:MAG: uroporphyrinogen-III C-methyltransferase, partial [Pseudomonadota bacterium]
SRFSGGLALMLAAIALVGSGYLWYLLFFERPELIGTDIAGRLEQVEGQDSELREKLGGLAEQVQVQRDNQDAIKTTLDKIHTDLARNRTEWLLTESEQLLVIANHRLQMARDVRSALSALRAADQQLRLVINPNMLPVRKELAREIGLLDALEKLDVNGIALRLGTLAEGVERLPLALEARWPKDKTSAAKDKPADNKPEADSGWRAALRGLWRDLQNLVRLRTDIETQKPLLPPEQQYFLRENLRLMLYGAQNALLQGSVATYQQNVKAAGRWVREYYDVNTQVVATTLAELDKLAAMKLAAELPDISASLETLRRLGGRRTAP